MTTSTEPFFSGPEQVILSTTMGGRPFRMGSSLADGVSDLDQLRTHIRNGDHTAAQDLLNALVPLHELITMTFLEWALAIPNKLSQKTDATLENECRAAAMEIWKQGSPEQTTLYTESAISDAIKSLASLGPTTVLLVRSNRALGQSTVLNSYIAYPHQIADEIAKLLTNNPTLALEKVDLYGREIRARHDLMAYLVSVFGTVIAKKVSQTACIEVLQEGLESCPVLEHLWAAVAVLSPEAIAAMLAEHLRHHFSGSGRQGAVRVVETEDCYRLIFEPCGTGGALRQSTLKGLSVLPVASPATWMRANEIPPYCAHCAMNELTSIAKFGYPAWVTEFNPDPNQPCGWTIYKDRNRIPDRYYTRLNMSPKSKPPG